MTIFTCTSLFFSSGWLDSLLHARFKARSGSASPPRRQQARTPLETAIVNLAFAEQQLASARATAERAAIAKRAGEQWMAAQSALLLGPALIRTTAQQTAQDASDAALAFQKASAALQIAEQAQASAATALLLARSSQSAHQHACAEPAHSGNVADAARARDVAEAEHATDVADAAPITWIAWIASFTWIAWIASFTTAKVSLTRRKSAWRVVSLLLAFVLTLCIASGNDSIAGTAIEAWQEISASP